MQIAYNKINIDQMQNNKIYTDRLAQFILNITLATSLKTQCSFYFVIGMPKYLILASFFFFFIDRLFNVSLLELFTNNNNHFINK